MKGHILEFFVKIVSIGNIGLGVYFGLYECLYKIFKHKIQKWLRVI